MKFLDYAILAKENSSARSHIMTGSRGQTAVIMHGAKLEAWSLIVYSESLTRVSEGTIYLTATEPYNIERRDGVTWSEGKREALHKLVDIALDHNVKTVSIHQ
jgi:hypothetical protein